MVNFSLNLASLVGIALAIGGIGLYFVRTVRPELSRDYDLFFAAVALLCGGILFFYGWRFDPIMQFGQILLGGSTVFFALENIRLRGVTTSQAKRQASPSPIVDEERRVSRVYEVDAQLDDLEPVYDRPIPRRIPGTRDSRPSRDSYYSDEEPRRRPSNRSNDYDRPSSEERPRRRRPRPPESGSNPRPRQWEASVESEGGAPRGSSEASPRRRRRPPEDPSSGRNWDEESAAAPAGDAARQARRYRGEDASEYGTVASTDYAEERPRRYRGEDASEYGTAASTDYASTDYAEERSPSYGSDDWDDRSNDYVDYQPIDANDEEDDNSGQFDK